MADIITLGELLIDLTQKDVDGDGNGQFTAYPGGAPANVAVAAARLGARTGFIGKVGADSFGRSLASVLERESVNTNGLYTSDTVPTTLAIVSVDETGEREFSFYRTPGADTQLTEDEAVRALEAELSDGSGDENGGNLRILHIGSLSMTDSPSREACEAAIRYARDNGMLVSYDPNYRAPLWESEEKAIEMMKYLLPSADILKVSEDEMAMLTGTEDLDEGSRILTGYGIRLVMVTLGENGVFFRMGNMAERITGFSVSVADTNGAGDTFVGAMLAKIAQGRQNLEEISEDDFRGYILYANKAASITCSRSGAIPAMPTAAEVEESFRI